MTKEKNLFMGRPITPLLLISIIICLAAIVQSDTFPVATHHYYKKRALNNVCCIQPDSVQLSCTGSDRCCSFGATCGCCSSVQTCTSSGCVTDSRTVRRARLARLWFLWFIIIPVFIIFLCLVFVTCVKRKRRNGRHHVVKKQEVVVHAQTIQADRPISPPVVVQQPVYHPQQPVVYIPVQQQVYHPHQPYIPQQQLQQQHVQPYIQPQQGYVQYVTPQPPPHYVPAHQHQQSYGNLHVPVQQGMVQQPYATSNQPSVQLYDPRAYDQNPHYS